MTFRKVFFWLHLVAGIAAGIVILIMSVTGVLLTYEKQIVAWVDREHLDEQSTTGVPRMPVESLLKTVERASGSAPTALTFYSGSSAASAAAGGTTYYVNAHTGELMGTGSIAVRAFFRSVTDWHRYVALSGDSRPWGKSLTGASNLIFLFIVASGAYLWWRGAVLWFRKGLSGRALYFNWHNVFGLWTLLPLFLVVLSATVISYPWASRMVYTLTGTEPPPQRGERGGAGEERRERRGGGGEAREARENGGRGGGALGGEGRGEGRGERPGEQQEARAETVGESRAEGQRQRRRERGLLDEGRTPSGRQPNMEQGGERPSSLPAAPKVDLTGVDAAITQTEQQVPNWRTLAVRLPSARNASLNITVDEGGSGQPHLRSTLTMDSKTGISKLENFESQNLGQRTRSWLRYVHTGEYYGFIGQTIAGIASLAGVLLVWTGFALSAQRLAAWLKRRTKASERAGFPAQSQIQEES